MKTVIYLGERVNPFGKIYQLFRDKSGKDYHFTGIKGVWFGSCYEVSDEDTIKIRPQSVEGFGLTDKDRLEFEAHKEIVKAERLQKRKAMELKKPHPDIVRAVSLLRPFYRSLNRIDQDRFCRYLSNELSKKVRKK